MPRRPPSPDQLSLAITLPTATALRAELADQVKRKTKRRFRHFSTWPKTGTRVLVHWEGEGLPLDTEPGTVTQQGWDPVRGKYCIVRLDRADAPPVTVDELRALSPLEE
jgi:hypothetical protein